MRIDVEVPLWLVVLYGLVSLLLLLVFVLNGSSRKDLSYVPGALICALLVAFWPISVSLLCCFVWLYRYSPTSWTGRENRQA